MLNASRLLCRLFLAVVVIGGASPAIAQQSFREQVDTLVQPYMDNEVVVGMAIGVLKDGKTEFFGYGQVGKTDDSKPDETTVYEIGSISKVFTGLLLADAITQGHVTLDQPAVELLPDGTNMPIFDEEHPITLKHLSTHCSGLPRLPSNIEFTDPENPYASYTPKLLYAFLNTHQPVRAPGKQIAYSNLGAGLLGHLLSRQQKMSYEELLRLRIAKPLRLSDTTISLTPDQQKRLALPYRNGGLPAANWDIPTLAGAGAIRSTANDMLKFAQAHLSPPQGKFGQAIELAWQVHQQPLTENDFALGLGWHLARDKSTRWHNGQTGGYHSMLMVNRKLNAAVILLANTATDEIDPLAGQIIRLTAGAGEKPRKFEKALEVAPEVLKRYVGKYQLAPGFVFTVTTKNKKLFVELTGQAAYQVFPKSETKWFYKVVPAELTFEVDDNGKCHTLELFQNGVRQKAKRIED